MARRAVMLARWLRLAAREHTALAFVVGFDREEEGARAAGHGRKQSWACSPLDARAMRFSPPTRTSKRTTSRPP